MDRPKQLSFKLSKDDKFTSKIGRSKENEDLITHHVEIEIQRMTHITSSFTSAFRFLNQVYERGNEEKFDRRKLFSVAPLTKMIPYFITLDALGLKQLNHNKNISVSELIESAKKISPPTKNWGIASRLMAHMPLSNLSHLSQ